MLILDDETPGGGGTVDLTADVKSLSQQVELPMPTRAEFVAEHRRWYPRLPEDHAGRLYDELAPSRFAYAIARWWRVFVDAGGPPERAEKRGGT